jgi:hypothetical protein
MVEMKKYILLVGVEGKTCLMYAGDRYSNIYHDKICGFNIRRT